MDFINKTFFSSYKRLAGLLVLGAMILSVPITITLLFQRQDIRQRAEGGCTYRFGGAGFLCYSNTGPSSSSSIPPLVPDNTSVTNGNTTYVGNGGYAYPGTTIVPGLNTNPGTFIYPSATPAVVKNQTVTPTPTGFFDGKSCDYGGYNAPAQCGTGRVCTPLCYTAGCGGVGSCCPTGTLWDMANQKCAASVATPTTKPAAATASACATNNNAGGCGGGLICCRDGTCAAPGSCAEQTCPQGFSSLCNACCPTGSTCTAGQGGYQCVQAGTCLMGFTCFAPSSCVGNVCVAPTSAPPPPPPPTATATPTPTPGVGNNNPTATPTPTGGQNGGSKALALKISLPGMGKGTDPKVSLNNAPKRPNRSTDIKIINAQGTATSATGSLAYNTASGKFEGSINTSVADGPYTIKVRMDNTLWKAVPGIIQLANGSATIPEVTLVTGDVSQDNQMNIDDYNALISCFGKSSCTNHDKTDLNDDGVIDELDLNLMIAAFLKRNGD